MKNTISDFHGKYFFLSNFFSAPVTYCGVKFKNNEAAFQSAKCPSRALEFSKLNPSDAKHLGRCVELRKDWENVKSEVMYDICLAKFTENPELATALKDTGDALLVEGNNWGDKVWGVCNGVGENRLGKILMSVRAAI